MATPRRDTLRRPDVPRRRSARQALAVIPSPAGSNISPAPDPAARRYSVDSNNSAPSPDEMVIQRRGRRKSIVWSPDVESIKRESIFRDRTPGKSPTKALSHITLRSTPRKRLQLDDSDVEMVSPEERDRNLLANRFTGSLSSGLRGLSHEQLVKMIMDLVSMQEDHMMAPNDQLRDIILRKMPVADIQPLKEKLGQLRQTVYASLVPYTKGESDYSRAYVHLENFQRALREQGQTLVDSQHWTAVVQYVFSAWSITKDLPEWKSQGTHSTTQKCYKYLTDFCLQGLKNGTFAPTTLSLYKEKLQTLLEDFSEVNVCLQFINNGKA